MLEECYQMICNVLSPFFLTYFTNDFFFFPKAEFQASARDFSNMVLSGLQVK